MKLQFIFLILFISFFTGCISPQVSEVNPQESDPWMLILQQARWAQNAHNMQSWSLKRHSSTRLSGGLEPKRLLPETDPVNRQLILSLGALSEYARQTAVSLGWELEIQWVAPEGWIPAENPGETVFQWDLIPLEGQGKNPGFPLDGLTSPTVKYATSPGAIPADRQKNLVETYSTSLTTFRFINKTDEMERVKQIAMEAFKTEMEYEPTLLESYSNTFIGRKERSENPYGLTLMGNFPKGKIGMVELFSRLFPMKPEVYGEKGIQMFGKTLEGTEQLLVMTTRGNSPEIQFTSGKAMQALWMEALNDGYTLLPLSQGLQEYPQVSLYYEDLHDLLAENSETIQMIFAVNRPADGTFLPSPRLPLSVMLEE